MTLTNYWWLLIWMFTGAAFFAVFMPKREEIVLGKKEMRWTPLAAVLAVLPYIIWAGFRGDVADTYLYRKLFNEMPTSLSNIVEYMSTINKDKGFSVLSVIIKSIIGNNSIIYFMIFAVFQLGILIFIFRKYSCDYWFSIFVFIASTDYISWMYNGLRQFTAVTIIVAGLPLYLKRKYIPSILLILLASTLHGSALLMIPVLFILDGKAWNKKTILSIIVCGLILIYISQFTNILDTLLADTQYKNVISDWKEFQDDGMNPIRALVYAIPMILSIVGYRFIYKEDDILINFCTNASILTVLLCIIATQTSGIFIGRLPIYVSIFATSILLPWEIDHIFTKSSAQIIKIVAVVCYCVFFYYQMHFTWNFI